MSSGVGDHTVRQESDEYICYHCHKRWDVREEPPSCEPRPTHIERETIATPKAAPSRYAPDRVLLFRMIRSVEQRYPDISDVLKGKVLKQYTQWGREQFSGPEDR